MNKRKEKENSEIKFLFFFSPENVSINSFVCYDIKTGVIITSFILILCAISNFIEGINQMFISYMVFSIIKSILYTISAIYLIISIIYINYSYIKLSHFIFEILICYNYVCLTLYFILSLFYLRLEDYQIQLAIMFYETIAILFFIYLDWVIYSYIKLHIYNKYEVESYEKISDNEKFNNIEE
jgi:hypothetical protein